MQNMRNWNDEVQMIQVAHRRRKCYSVIAIILAIVVAISVFGSLILPAISMTWDSNWASGTTGSFVSTEDIVDDGDTGQNLTAPLHNAAVQSLSVYSDCDIDMSSYVTDVKSGYDADEDGVIYGDSATVSFTLTYAGLPLTSTTLYYELPEGLTPISGSSSSGSTTTTSNSWYQSSGTYVTGSYEIVQDPDTDKYYIIITYTDAYYAWVRANTTGTISGGIEFNGSVARDETASGDRTLSFQTAAGFTDITIPFSDADLTMKKEATSVTGSDGNVVITWTITIQNSGGLWDLEGKTLTDVLTGAGSGMTTSIGNVSVSPAEAVASNSNGDFTFASTEGIETITITYTTTVTASDFDGEQLTNTATLQYGDDADHTVTSSANVTLKEISISKSGQTDYSVSGDAIAGNIDWTITVQDQYGSNLTGAVISDDQLKNAIDGTLVVKDTDGNDVNYTTSTDNATGNVSITISSTTATKVIITYSTNVGSIESGSLKQTVTNTATVSKSGMEDSATAYVTYDESEIYTLMKNGVYDADTKQVTWSIVISTGNNNNHTLNGYQITDTKFTGMSVSNITVYAATSQWSGWADASASVTIDGDTLTVLTNNAKYIVLTYTEAINIGDYTAVDGTYTFTNTVSDKYGDTSTGTAGYTPRNTFMKSASVETVTEIGTGSTAYVVDWMIYWTNDNGFNNETIYDQLGDGLTLYGNITVEVSADGITWITLTENSDYTILTETGSEYSFALSGISSEYHYLRVKYQTVSDFSSVDYGNNESATKKYTNTAWHGSDHEGETTGSFDYTLRNPNKVATLDITVNKDWDLSKGYDGTIVKTTTSSGTGNVVEVKDSNNNSTYYEVPEISFYILQRTTDTSSEWAYLAYNATTCEYSTVDSKDQAYKFTTSNLSAVVSGLPAEAFIKDEDGTYSSITYVYKVEEVDECNGGTISDQYDTTYGNNNIIAYGSGTVTITNSYRAFYYKTAIDSNGNEINSINMADMPTIYEGGVKYYIINWKIVFYAGEQTALTDTLPDHFSLVYTGETDANGSWKYNYSDAFVGDAYNLSIGYGEQDKVYDYIVNPFYYWEGSGGYFVKLNGLFSVNEDGTVTFGKDNNTYDVIFSTKIAESDLYAYYTDESSFDEDGNLIGNIAVYNTASSENGASDTAKLTITPKEPVVAEGEYITKSFEPNVSYDDANRYDIYYTLDINPDGYTLSSSDTIDVTDTLTKVVDSNGNALSVQLKSIDVYTVDGDGNKTLLDAGSYSYNIEYNLEDVSKPEPTVINNPTGTSYTGTTYTNVESVTFRLKSSYTNTGWWFAFKLNGSGSSYGAGNDLYLPMTVSSGNATVSSSDYCKYYSIDGYDVTIKTAEAGYTTIDLIAVENGNFSDAVESITINYLSETGGVTPAQITLTLPDATHIYVEYHYTLVDVDEEVTVNMTNVATVSTNQVDESVTCDNNNVFIAHSSAYVEADGYPVIYKTNVAATGTHLNTQFYLCKYDNGTWYYATGVAVATDQTGTEVTDSSGNAIYTCTGWSTSKDDATVINMTSDGFRFNSFETGWLYCFMEVSQATDPNDESAVYETFSESEPYCYYFTYVGGSNDYSDVTGVNNETDITIDTMSLATTSGGAVNVPNNKLITIQAQKLWDNAETWTTDDSVELTLMVSSTRSISGVPDDAEVVTSLSNDEQNPQELSSEGATAEWTILPNGSDGKPLYYYVVETAYTVNGTKYTLAEDGKYYDSSNNEGSYSASYSSMAIVDNAVFDTEAGTSGVTVNNSSGLVVAKRWTDVDNKTTSAYMSEIKFELYGTIENGDDVKIGTGTLNDSNNWMIHIAVPSSDENFVVASGISGLGDYTGFYVVEIQEYDGNYPLYGYTISYISQVTDGQGVITIVNKNNTQTTCNVTVEKVWGSGTSGSEVPIQVTLYQSTTSYSIDAILAMTEEERTAALTTTIYTYDTSEEGEDSNSAAVDNPVWLGGDSSGSFDSSAALKYTWSNLPYTDGEGNRYYYYVIETSPSETVDWQASYSSVSGANPKYTITNYVPGVLDVEKKWIAGDTELSEEEAANYTATFEIYRNRTSNDPAVTSASALQTLAAVNGGTGSITVDAIGDSITRGEYQGYVSYDYTYPVQLESMLKNKYSSVQLTNHGTDGYTTKEILTTGSHNCSSGSNMSEIAHINTNTDVVCILSGTNDVLHCSNLYELSGVSVIESLITAVYDQVTNEDVVVLIGSIPHFNFVDEDANTVNDTYTWLWANYQFSDYDKIVKTDNVYSDEALAAAQDWEDFANGYVDSFNADIQTAVAELQSTYPTLQYVDVCGAVDKDTMLYDGVHPNETGYQAIATAFYQAIIDEVPEPGTEEDTSESGGASTVVNNGMPSDFYTYDVDGNLIINEEKYIQVTNFTGVTSNVTIDEAGKFVLDSSHNWSARFQNLPTTDASGTKYKYYVVEVNSTSGDIATYSTSQTVSPGWTVSYDGEGVIVGSDGTVSGSITITNTLDVIDLSIEKFWNDLDAETASDHNTGTVTFTLYRTTSKLEAGDQTSSLMFIDENGNVISEDDGITISTSGNGATITTSTAIQSISYDSSQFSISYDAGTCSFSIQVAAGVTADSDIVTSIIITDTNNISKELTVTITNMTPLTLKNASGTEITSLDLITGVGQTVTASVTGGGTVTSLIVSENDGYTVTTSENEFTIIAEKVGTYTITVQATCDGGDGCGDGKYHEATLTVTVSLPDSFEIVGDTSVDIEGTITLTPSPNYGTFTWSSGDSSIATVDSNGVVTGGAAGSVKITATRTDDDKTASITITVNEAATQKTLTNVTDALKIDSSRPVDYIDFVITGNSWTELYLFITGADNNTVSFKVGFFGLEYSGTELVIEDGSECLTSTKDNYTLETENGTSPATLKLTLTSPSCLSEVKWVDNNYKSTPFSAVSYTVHYASTAKTSLTPYASSIETYSIDYSQCNSLGSYTISGNAGNDWTIEISDLLQYDPEGNPYYYFVVEENVNGYVATYWYDGETCINAASCSSDSPGEIRIENVRTESTDIALPSTGGDGTGGYVATGIACITTATIGTILNFTWRRKRRHVGVTRHGKE